MAGKWTGGVVAATRDEEPPRVEEWTGVSVPGRPEAFVDADGPIAYRTAFDDPRPTDAQRMLLVLEGVYGRVRVWVNDEYLGEHAIPFAPARFEFEPKPENEVLIVCYPPSSCGGLYETDEVPEEFAIPSVRRGVDVQILPETFIRDVTVAPRLTEDGASIDATVEVDAGGPTDESVTLSLRPEGFRGGGSMERARIDTAGAERVTVTKTLAVRDPSLWWPRGHGPQHRYTVRAKLGEHSVERTTGLRRVERDDDGLLVNGKRVHARGFTRLLGGDERADVERATAANATLLRARAHVPSHEFHEACDEAGLLVWQDLPITGSAVDVEQGTALATALSATYGHHPSIACYGVQDEPIDPFEQPLGSGWLDRLRFRWRCARTGVDHTDAETVASAFPDEMPVIDVAGAPGTDPDAAHLFPGWQYLEAADIEWLLNRYPALGQFVGGFGAGSLTTDDATAVRGLDRTTLKRRAEDAEQSQRYQATVAKTVAETLRRRGCGAFAAATLRDPSEGGGMGVLAADGTEKPAYGALADAYERVQAVLDGPPSPGSNDVTVCNDTGARIETTLAWEAGDETGETAVSVDPFAIAAAGTIEVPADAEDVVLSLPIDDRTVRNRYRL